MRMYTTTPDKLVEKNQKRAIFLHYGEWKHGQCHRNAFPPLSPLSMLSLRFDGASDFFFGGKTTLMRGEGENCRNNNYHG